MKRLGFLIYLLFLLFPCGTIFAASFTVTIDAGHGGKDPGAIGSFAKEKNINLSVALKVGQLIESRYPDVKVVYTRKTDVFIPLEERAMIANNAHSNLFLCIHTNSSPSPAASGAETYTLGLAKTQANMNVARRENSVILLEDNYKQKYQGFNPNSTDSYIMFEYMQDKYIDQSVQFASDVQSQFAVTAKRTDRGVRQAGFWVLHRTSMAAVLVEVGYITNQSEEEFLSSSEGQQRLAEAIVAAFGKFKHDHDRRSGKFVATLANRDTADVNRSKKENNTDIAQQVEVEKPVKPNKKQITHPIVAEPPEEGKEVAVQDNKVSEDQQLVFKVQFYTSPSKLRSSSAKFKGITDVSYYQEHGSYKYTTGDSADYKEVVNRFRKVVKVFPDAFIVAFQGDQKMALQEAIKRWKTKK